MATTTKKTSTTKTASDETFFLSVGSFELSAEDVKTLVTDSAYAYVGAGDLAVSVVRDLPGRLESLRKDQAALVKDAPAKAQTFVKDAPSKLQAEINAQLDSVRGEVDTYATRGRKLVDGVTEAPATKRVLDQTEAARTQVKGAVTSVRKVVEQGREAAQKAVGTIGSRRAA
ncbi:hypothetical protein [Euzebya tangerina]|uniref:hypothetical protein n=1 Tax=Euzebya tangerina TaxID=591198 RepID=UPI000E313808|nr:hypothetical protein [Euzebya tangerina]